ncbi:hypothetical protein MANES_14G134321v8 [Manihot esculenta]|uniref:Uncharacterized protein n=1 Tax=Manihot esculenta TaxID=3983 RepID=A0ACB7GKC8_MANES|nr:hypothetical protein MANES_14G134321v8 [Manihot esculenta]
MLKHRYITNDLDFRYYLHSTLYQIKQDCRQSIHDFYAHMRSIWDQIALSDFVWENSIDAQKFQKYRNEDKLIQFLMALKDEFESNRASLLHMIPLPTLDQVVLQLVSEETRLGSLYIQRTDMVMAISNISSNVIDVVAPSSKNGPIECRYCKKPAYHISNCRKLARKISSRIDQSKSHQNSRPVASVTPDYNTTHSYFQSSFTIFFNSRSSRLSSTPIYRYG